MNDDKRSVWWDAWFSKDFSWEGLARKSVHVEDKLAPAERTLQDYWRLDGTQEVMRTDDHLVEIGELIHDPNGRLWHIAHAPMHWPNGRPAKATWSPDLIDKLRSIVKQRLAAASSTPSDVLCYADGNDQRAKLVGTVIPGSVVSLDDILHLDARWSYCVGWDFKRPTFGPGAIFDNALLDDFYMWDSHFLGTTSFSNATFLRRTFFAWAHFEGYTSFSECVFENADFAMTKFDDCADFRAVHFLGNADFEETSIRLAAFFNNSNFLENAQFAEAHFQASSTFTNAQFGSKLDFSGCRFAMMASFEILVGRPNQNVGTALLIAPSLPDSQIFEALNLVA